MAEEEEEADGAPRTPPVRLNAARVKWRNAVSASERRSLEVLDDVQIL